ncbi:MAG TPA: hypothetical protein PLT37_10580 [Kiritimatiellia bacterium]|nr:hypothetical protein [Kiritimatiellia bacterium]
MNPPPTFICFSYLTVPKNEAQAFTASRFYSALAEAGGKVILVTLDHPEEIAPDVAQEMLSPKIELLRIPFSPPRNVRLWQRFRNRKRLDYNWWNVTPLAATRKVEELLRKNPGSILISRSFPLESHLTVYDIRRSARLWIPHFSDPLPLQIQEVIDDLNQTWMLRMRNRHDTQMVRNIIREAGLVTVTSRNAIRYFSELCGNRYAEKFHVANHIGVPRLASSGFVPARTPGAFEITHVGSLAKCRYPERIVAEFSRAAAAWPELRLTLYGQLFAFQDCPPNLPWLNLSPQRLPCPRQSTDVMAHSNMNLIVDAESSLPYGPFLASKYAYAVGVGRPVLGAGVADCEMAKLRDEFQSTYFADITKPGALAKLLLKIRDEAGHLTTPCPALQDRFSASTVAKEFLQRVNLTLQS